MIKIDLHTHSRASPDGGLSERDYAYILEQGLLDYIAVTDHNETSFAQLLQKRLGGHIIVGEEIMTTDGELIGLYLQETIPAGLAPDETIERIRDQGGVVYVPHPFETVRHGMRLPVLQRLAESVDIVEVHNGRALQNRSRHAHEWATANGRLMAASSDAHGRVGLGRTFTQLAEPPARDTLLPLLQQATFAFRRAPLLSYVQPKLNRTRRFLGRLRRPL